MPQEISEEQKRKLESYLNIHLKKDQRELSPEGQITALKKRDRNKWIHLVVNVAAIILFGYSFHYEITDLSETIFILILVVFVINIGLIFYQKKQISNLIEYLDSKRHG